MNRQQTDLDMRAVEFRADGTPTRYEVVPAEPTKQPYIIGHDDAIVAPMMPERTVKATSIVEGSWSDRARAFNLSTRNLSLVVGGMFLIAAWVFGPSLSFWTLAAAYFAGFSLTWLIAYALHVFVSAEGAQFLETVFLWRFLANEQQFRHQRYTQPPSDRVRLIQTVIGALAVGMLALFVLAVVATVAWENMPR